MFTQQEIDVIEQAKAIIAAKYTRATPLTNPELARDFLVTQFAQLEYEVFAAVWLDAQMCVIEFEVLFRGTINSAAVYPREVVKSALKVNAAACLFAHNHPSGNAEPSQADRLITERLIKALSTVEIQVVDHLVVGGTAVVSFAERGWL